MTTTIIPTFSFNTPQGRTILFNNITIEEIINKLQQIFPTWSREVATKIATNTNFHKEVLPINTTTKVRNKKVSFKNPIIVKGVEINNLLRLGKSIVAYHENGYRQWGTDVNNIFEDGRIVPYFNEFERCYEKLIKQIKNDTTDNLADHLPTIYHNLNNLVRIIKSTRILEDNGEYIEGRNRRLGLKIIIERSEEILNSLAVFKS